MPFGSSRSFFPLFILKKEEREFEKGKIKNH